ncbi:MAG: hypothetical protein LBE47_02070 [Methanomassiliicoccaceae archaeon]|jgi:predicted RNA binding protein with dsRBD fold (UPF0201 family)|nr:hypothetical protein [Methanomassiliicoccaceae archaeon]
MVQTIRISCPIFPSEDPERVMRAVSNIFPDAALDVNENMITAEQTDMRHFGEQIRRQRILDTARSVMIKGRKGERSVFHMNKQTAYAGKISFVEEKTILGTIKVTLEADDITEFIERIAPQTVDGEEVKI